MHCILFSGLLNDIHVIKPLSLQVLWLYLKIDLTHMLPTNGKVGNSIIVIFEALWPNTHIF